MMRKTIFIIFVLFGFDGYSQDLACGDFKKGIFTGEITLPSLNVIKWKIVRNGNEQSEIYTQIPEELQTVDFPTKPQYGIIKWIDDCSYTLIYDEKKSDLTNIQKTINMMGGFLNKITRIEGKCAYYKSTLTIGNETQVNEGKFCAE
ncbi:hypothetical protein [Winogradskyella ursingii]|uniref:hypothetical protein n=1 Tax=Winogradskyella ursingii TaxID=2686079 RepID=UPI0015C8F658|nr:hypothetical protein [Winogradskyella ursingii]